MKVIQTRLMGAVPSPQIRAQINQDQSAKFHPQVRPISPETGEEPVRTAAWLQDFSNHPNPPLAKRMKPIKLDSLKNEIEEALHDLESSDKGKKSDFARKRDPPEDVEKPSLERPDDVPVDAESSIDAKVHKGEYFVLKRNYDSLLSVLKEQEDQRMRQAAEIEALEHEIEETKAAAEVDLESYRLENVALKQKFRTVQEAKDVTVICDLYEDEISRLTQRIRTDRDETIAYLQEIERLQRTENEQINVDEASILQKEHKQMVSELRNSVKKLQIQLQTLEKEHAELKKQERRWKLNRKGLESISKRTGDLQNQVTKQKTALESLQETNQKLETELSHMQERNELLEKEVQEAVQDNERLVQDLKIMREVAISSGLSPVTVDRVQKNAPGPIPATAKLAFSLLQRLKKSVGDLGDESLLQLVENVAQEVTELTETLEATGGREQNLLHVLVDLQEKLSRQDPDASRQSNKSIRNSILASLSA